MKFGRAPATATMRGRRALALDSGLLIRGSLSPGESFTARFLIAWFVPGIGRREILR
jgi:hypothetical protein